MSIRCVCLNGHVLNVKDAQAGASGLCPACKVRVQVPQRPTQDMSEEAVLGFLGRRDPSPQVAIVLPDSAENPKLSGIHKRGTPKKSCYKCNREISSGTHICPHCRTYIAKLDDF